MKIWDLSIITFSLSLVGIIISGYILGLKYFDFSVWTALLIYFLPALLLSFANGLMLVSIQKFITNTYFRIGLGLIPVIILIGFLFWNEGPLHYIAVFGLIPIILTNLYWIIRFSESDLKASV